MSERLRDVLATINNTEHRQALTNMFKSLLDIDVETWRDGNRHVAVTNGVDTLQFNTSFEDGNAEGRLQWNSEDGTLEVGLSGGIVNLQIGQEVIFRGVNKSGSDIANGKCVYITGAQGSRPKIELAQADSIVRSGSVGVTTEAIPNNGNGYVTAIGLVREVDTSALAEGALLWLDPNTAGEFTATKPTAPDRSTAMGYCIVSNAESGIVLVHPTVVPGLLSLSDVFGIPNDGDVMVWDAANSRFKFQAP
jgi:hypothetical protein